MMRVVTVLLATGFCAQASSLVPTAPAMRPPEAAKPVIASPEQSRFNLECEFDGRVLADLYPGRRPVTPIPESQWHDTATYMVDLDSGRYCADFFDCRDLGPVALASVDHELIFFTDRPGHKVSVSRLTGEYFNLLEGLGRVTLEEGRCSARPFTPFPHRDATE